MYAALGRFCFLHRRAIGVSWLVLLVLGIVIGSRTFSRLGDPGGSKSVESVQGLDVLNAHDPTGPRLLAVVDGPSTDAAATRVAVTAAAAELRALPDVADVVDAFEPTSSPTLVAKDHHATLVVVDLRKGLPNGRQDAAVAAVQATLARVPGATVHVGGNPVMRAESNAQVSSDLASAETVSLPIAALVLVVIFGGVVAAGLPLAAAVTSVAGALLILYGFSHVWELSPEVPNVVTIMGLGLAIDYGLLLVNRFREERLGGLDVEPALERTMATAGRAISYSALTVMASLAGLFLFDEPTYRSMGAGGVSVVVVALLAGLTLVPALLAMLGNRIHAGVRPEDLAGRHPLRRALHKLSAPPPPVGVFSRLTERSQRHPVPVIVAVVGVLVVAGLPFLHAQFKQNETKALPRHFESRQVADALATRFPGNQVDPIEVVARVAPDDPRLTSYVEQLSATAGVASAQPERTRAADLTVIDVYPAGDPQGASAQALVHHLRDHRPGFPTYVTGMVAFLVDFQHQIAHGLPWALGFIALITFVLLFLMTGSVLVPLKALVMNTLSLSASFGALVWIFQEGHLSGLLGFESTGSIETWVPVIVFVFAFGLSMDYEVFLLSRIKELYDGGHPNDAAVATGLQRSGRIITSAALLIVVVFGGFAAGQTLGIKELGVALTLAVLVDATLVRCLLVPATMTLLGDANWWAPGPLRRLHDRIGLREGDRTGGEPGGGPQRPRLERSSTAVSASDR